MNPQERQMIDDLFGRLSGLENSPRDAEAAGAIAQGMRRAPNAVYALVQTVLVQDEALKRANARIQDLESGGAPADQPQGGFLDNMRDALFGQTPPRSSVPQSGSRAAWNTGQVLGQPQDRFAPPQGQPMQQPYGQAPMGGGGSFLGTAAAAAAGVVGGGLLMSSIRGMMGGGSHQGFGDSSSFGGGDRAAPWSGGSSNNELSRDLGINDIGKDSGSSGRSAEDSRSGLFDTASNDDDGFDSDDDDDGGDFGGDDSDTV